MSPRSYSLIAILILALLGGVVISSFILSANFFHRELTIAFPEKMPPQQDAIDRNQVARIARAMNLPGATDAAPGVNDTNAPTEVPPPALPASTSGKPVELAPPVEAGATTTIKKSPIKGR